MFNLNELLALFDPTELQMFFEEETWSDSQRIAKLTSDVTALGRKVLNHPQAQAVVDILDECLGRLPLLFLPGMGDEMWQDEELCNIEDAVRRSLAALE